ncbi:putative FtsJ-like methyltransferase [Megavirus courdo11]|uniref:Putative FtsJ-like methyltransferase n=1 Tax=Megavirus courdo11 TaxID=1128140 RepID=K7YFG8_9VIRU|nr:putative FtsJ-like methyltransferase [Megavirus courdo11]
MNELLVNKKSYEKIIVKTSKKIHKYSQNTTIGKLLVVNKYEKMIPFNLWFKHNKYEIDNHYENNQNMRIRYYNDNMLTPITFSNDNNLKSIKSLINNMSLYQPYFPEAFYSVWEILSLKCVCDFNNFAFIGQENRFGTVEAIFLYSEKNLFKFENEGHIWTSGNEIFDKLTNTCVVNKPEIDYIGQSYKVKYITNTNQLTNYDLIFIDSLHMFDDLTTWNQEERDLHATIYYFFTALEKLNNGASIIIRLNMLSSKSWYFILDFSSVYFKEYTFYRPKSSNPFDSQVYLILNMYKPSDYYSKFFITYMKNLYSAKIYEIFSLNYNDDIDKSIYQKYQQCREYWIDSINSYIDNTEQNNNDIRKDYITKWHHNYGLKQNKDCQPYFNTNIQILNIETSNKKHNIKLSNLEFIAKNKYYREICKHKSMLNYYKRVMDTKPSRIFNEERYIANYEEQCLTWDNLTYKLDTYRQIKRSLKNEFNAELVTNAWIKLYEILHEFNYLIPDKMIIKTFHLCEAPGAFISATNHYLDTINKKLDWYAQTLNPIQNDIALNDHYGLISKYPKKWIFGDPNIDMSGDITHSQVIKYYRHLPELQNIDFMTADAGIKCNPIELNNQELILSKINMGQIICILSCLPKHKSAIFKTFLPMSEPLTISMIYLLSNKFSKVTLIKPTSSNSSNSEIYIVLQDYQGISDQDLEILYILLDDPKITSNTMLFENINDKFMKSYSQTINSLMKRQIDSLSRNYYYYYHIDEINRHADNIFTDEWFNKYSIGTLKNHLL